MKPFAALPLLALAGCSVCQPTRFARPVFNNPISAPILESDSGSGQTSEREPSASNADPSSAPSEQPSTPATETPSTPSEPAAEMPAAETPATQTPSAPSTNDGVGGQQETREESHDRG